MEGKRIPERRDLEINRPEAGKLHQKICRVWQHLSDAGKKEPRRLSKAVVIEEDGGPNTGFSGKGDARCSLKSIWTRLTNAQARCF